MKIAYELEEHESYITPLKIAEALVDSGQLDHDEMKELIAYLSVFTRYNPD